jgi:hypothetical protein
VKRFSKRSIFLSLAVALVAAVAAVAYWTAGGTGTGSASAGSTTAITVVQTTVLTPMYPGDTAQTISGKFNNTNSGPVYVGTVTASIGTVTKAGGAPGGTCDATDFTLASAAMTVSTEVPSGSAQGAWTGATIKFNNKASNQDACKGATVAINYAIS